MKQKFFNLTNGILPILEKIEKNLLPGAPLKIEQKLNHNVSFRNKYSNEYNCFKKESRSTLHQTPFR
jgi:hypothetical protein